MNEYEYRIPLFGPNYSNSRIVRIIRSNTVSDLEVGVLKDIGCCVKVLDLLEGTHDLLPDHAALLVNQLDGGPLAIMGHTVPHLHRSSRLFIICAIALREILEG